MEETKSQMTAEPREVDAVVKRAWQVIYNGMSGCITAAVEQILEKYNNMIAKFPEADLLPVDADMVFESFNKTKDSAAALDGWNPKELSLLSHQTCAYIAVVFNQIEAGAPWPRSSTHALIATGRLPLPHRSTVHGRRCGFDASSLGSEREPSRRCTLESRKRGRSTLGWRSS